MILLCDASSDGTGAVLSHELPDGKPIAFASRIFTAFEKNYMDHRLHHYL